MSFLSGLSAFAGGAGAGGPPRGTKRRAGSSGSSSGGEGISPDRGGIDDLVRGMGRVDLAPSSKRGRKGDSPPKVSNLYLEDNYVAPEFGQVGVILRYNTDRFRVTAEIYATEDEVKTLGDNWKKRKPFDNWPSEIHGGPLRMFYSPGGPGIDLAMIGDNDTDAMIYGLSAAESDELVKLLQTHLFHQTIAAQEETEGSD